MYGGDWALGSDGTVSVDLEDYSKFMDVVVPPMMYENATLTEVVYRICDAIGFQNYKFTTIDENKDFVIPVWYTNGEETAWELFDQLAKDTQSLIYFDALGVLNIKPRYAAFDPNRAVDWTMLGIQRGSDLANIAELQKTGNYESNLIKVMYSYTRWSEWNNGNPSMATVWEPEDTMALRSVAITQDITDTEQGNVHIAPRDAKIWPFEAMANIEGEIFKFDAKRYIWHDDTGTPQPVWLESQEDFEKYNEKTPQEYRHANHFNGMIRIKERGLWNSHVRAHSYKPKSMEARRFVDGHNITSNRGVFHNVGDSSVTLKSAGMLTRPIHRLLYTTGSAGVVGDYRHYGTRVVFEKGDGYTHQIAGLVINNTGTMENGYYIEITPTNKLTAEARKSRHEVTVYIRKYGSDKKPAEKIGCEPLDLGSETAIEENSNNDNENDTSNNNDSNNEGGGAQSDPSGWAEESAKQAIALQSEYDIDVRLDVTSSGKHRIRVWINGRLKIDTFIKAADTISLNTKFAVDTTEPTP
jgi:hypothetical protein